MSAVKTFVFCFAILGLSALVSGCADEIVSAVEDEVPVLPPTNVTASPSESEKIVISWDPNSHPQLYGYNVYRMDVDAQEVIRLNSAPLAATEYNDLTARRGVNYEFRVTAVTKANKESAYTPVAVYLQADAADQQNQYRGGEL